MKDNDPPEPNQPRVRLTPELRSKLREHMDRTGKGARAILRDAHGRPNGLTTSTIQSWLKAAQTAREDHLRYTFSLYEGTESASDQVDWSPELVAELQAEQARTGVGVIRLLRDRTDVPDRLKPQRIYNLLAGRIVGISAEELHYVRRLWRELPSVEFVDLTPKIIMRLGELAKDTGKGSQAILRGASDKPEGLKSDVIRRWLAGAKKARKDHLGYVLERYETFADQRTPRKRAPARPDRWSAERKEAANAHARIWDMIGALSQASRDEPHLALRLVRSESFRRMETSLRARGYRPRR